MANKLKKREKGRGLRFWAWQTMGVSTAANFIVIGFVTIYCTNALHLDPALVGVLLMASKIVDAVTDLFAGYIVDKTNTKWGKGRPYEWAIIGVWLCTWLMFSAPAAASTVVKSIWVLAMYIFVNAIFSTLLNASGNPYMIRAIGSNEERIEIASFGGIVVMIASIVINITFPIAMSRIATSPAGWSRMIALFAVPLGLIGILRFFLVKETIKVDDVGEERVKFADVITVLKKNPYVYMIAALQLVYSLVNGTGVMSYFYTYVVGNVEIMGIVNSVVVIVLPVLFFFPLIMKKIPMGKLVQIGCVVYAVGAAMTFLAIGNIPILVAAAIIMGVGVLPITYLMNLLMLDCGTYNSWKGYKRMDGTIGAIKGFAGKLGSAFGSGLLGWLLSAAAFDPDATVQNSGTLFAIRSVQGLIPAILFVGLAIMMCFYKLDKLMPQIKADLEERNISIDN